MFYKLTAIPTFSKESMQLFHRMIGILNKLYEIPERIRIFDVLVNHALGELVCKLIINGNIDFSKVVLQTQRELQTKIGWSNELEL